MSAQTQTHNPRSRTPGRADLAPAPGRTLENMTAAAELAAGYARMENSYYQALAEVAA